MRMRMRLAWLLVIPALVVIAVLLRDHEQQEPAAAAQAATHCELEATDATHPGMVWVPGGSFTMGSDGTFPEEAPRQSASVDGFWMDQTEVTNAQFAAFVAATGYRTLAEREGVDGAAGSAVFRPAADSGPGMTAVVNWWQFVAGADWRHPDGPQGSLDGLDSHPVVHVAYEDAQAYAQWKGHSLPTEAQFEYAARNSGRRHASGGYAANTWQGSFPAHDAAIDGYAGTAPVGCFGANPQRLYDLIGNVWEWTSSPYYDRHDFAGKQAHPRGFDSTQPKEAAVAVLKGGSFLCAPDYCMRYRPEARIGQSLTLGAAHIGFRTVLDNAR